MICLAFNFTGSLHAELLQMKITLLFLTNLIASLALNAAQDTTSTKLDEVIIQENRIQIPFSKQSRNITNTDYIEAGTVQMPGRWFRAGIIFNLN